MENAPQQQSPRNLWLVAALLTAMAASLLVALIFLMRNFSLQPNGPGRGPTKIKYQREETLKLLDQRDRAVALLENHEFAQADELLTEIIRQVPDDPFGPRNLTICRELALGTIDATREAGRYAEMLVKAREALEGLQHAELYSHVPHVLDARISVRANEIDKAEVSLRKASELAPKSAPVWYDLYSLRPMTPGEPPAPETVEALRKTHELEPDNLFVLKDWLPLLAQLKDPAFADTAEQAKETLKPFAEIIKTHARVDVLDLLDIVAKAAREDQWPLATGRTMAIRNVMVSEAARDDRYVKLDSLEYVLQDFGPVFYERADTSKLNQTVGVPIDFVKAADARQSAVGVEDGYDIVVGDFDLDGSLDALVCRSREFSVAYRLSTEAGDAAKIVRTTETGGIYEHACVVDLDDDVDPKLKDRPKNAAGCQLADPDVIVFGKSGIQLFENREAADGSREFIGKPVGAALASLRNVDVVTPVDLDLDGDLDFVTASASEEIRLWSNRSNWSFEEITARSALPPETFVSAKAIVVVDWDRDSDTDLLMASGAGRLGLLENLRHGRYRFHDLGDEFAVFNQPTKLFIDDLDGNGSWDVIGLSKFGQSVILTQRSAGGLVSVKNTGVINPEPKWFLDSVMLDFDNDGLRDLAILTLGGIEPWRGQGDGSFTQLAVEQDPNSTAWIASLAVGDVDRDGDEDLIGGRVDGSEWYSNEGGNANGWLDVSLLAQQIKPNEQNYSKRVNHAGIGSTIEVKAGGRYQARVVTGPITHFGLGPRKKADVVRVIWTNGVPRNLIDPEPNLHVCEEQKLVGSCPYLYTWDGEKFSFVTDLLWNSPIGLKFAENVVAPWREWEYIKIDGDRLKAKDGEYRLQITEELWEAGYFDQVKLFAIDHPAGTDIYTNEKVGSASMAEHTIHTVHSPRLPIAAKDTHGRDILDQVKARDGIYTKTYDRKLAQGLTTEHFLELDLGKSLEPRDERREPEKSGERKAAPPKPTPALDSRHSALDSARITLFLTGWVYPTSTSLNVQFSQNPDMAQPRPPALHAVDANGQWREVRPFMGFPGGKTKTIAIDISDVFAPGSTDHRLRIVTNMEFYWDHAFFTVDEAPVEIRQSELPLLRADLHDRGGISFREYDPGNGPEFFDYSRLVPGGHWPPMAGAFTRFGDIRELLVERDDKLLVLGCNDEMSLAFAEPSEPLPAGWVRDFVIYNVGWDKDSDMNTVYGETVEPLPFRDMTVYAHRDGQPRPLDEDYVRYLRTYQTRGQSRPKFWNEIRRRSTAD